MKIRAGFVSNSSSSSFLVYIGNAAGRGLSLGCTDYELTYGDFESMIEHAVRQDWCSECTEVRHLTWSEMLDMYDPKRAWDPEAYERALARAREVDKDQSDDDYVWMDLTLSYRDSALLNILRALHEEGIITVVYDEEERVIKDEN